MSPADFLEGVVRPNRAEFIDEHTSLRRAFNLVASIDALAAHLFDWLKANRPELILKKETDSQFRGRLSRSSREFQIVRDIAKAQKHVQLDDGKPLLRRSDQIVSRPVAWGEGPYGDGKFGGPAQVVVTLDDGSLEYVRTISDRALAFLEGEMKTLGVTS